jgi:hypothetical protein
MNNINLDHVFSGSSFVAALMENYRLDSRNSFIFGLFDFSRPIERSDIETIDGIAFFGNEQAIDAVIIKKTKWLLRSDDSNYYGLVGDHVVMLDTEANLTYCCHGLQNLPYYLLDANDISVDEMVEIAQSKGGVQDFKGLLTRYEEFCKRQGVLVEKTRSVGEADFAKIRQLAATQLP